MTEASGQDQVYRYCTLIIITWYKKPLGNFQRKHGKWLLKWFRILNLSIDKSSKRKENEISLTLTVCYFDSKLQTSLRLQFHVRFQYLLNIVKLHRLKAYFISWKKLETLSFLFAETVDEKCSRRMSSWWKCNFLIFYCIKIAYLSSLNNLIEGTQCSIRNELHSCKRTERALKSRVWRHITNSLMLLRRREPALSCASDKWALKNSFILIKSVDIEIVGLRYTCT